MKLRPRPQYLVLVVCPLTIAGLTGCKSGSDDGTGIDVDSEVEFDMLAGVLRSELSTVAGAFMVPGTGEGCVTLTADPDGDGDGIPDQADFTFSSSGCKYTFDGGWGTSAGAMHVADAGDPFGFTATLSSMAYTTSVEANADDPAQTRILTLNGERTVGGSATRLTLTQTLTFTYTVTSRPSATGTETWQAVFTADQGSTVAFGYGMRVPDGDTEVSGPFEWTQNGATVRLTLETVDPLRFPTSCQSPFPSSGEVHARVVSGAPAGYVRLAWSSCGGEAQVDWVAG